MKNHSEKLVGELCNYLGEDLQNPMCQELMLHLEDCPECKKYVESVKLTISLCKDCSPSEAVPENVREQLLQKLKKKI